MQKAVMWIQKLGGFFVRLLPKGLRPLAEAFLSREVILYGIFGVLTTVVNIVAYKALTVAGIYYLASNALAWVIAVLFAFGTNRRYVFESKAVGLPAVGREFFLFVVCRLLSGVFDMAFMFVSVDVLHINDLLAKIVSNIVVILINYFLSKLVIFKKRAPGA